MRFKFWSVKYDHLPKNFHGIEQGLVVFLRFFSDDFMRLTWRFREVWPAPGLLCGSALVAPSHMATTTWAAVFPGDFSRVGDDYSLLPISSILMYILYLNIYLINFTMIIVGIRVTICDYDLTIVQISGWLVIIVGILVGIPILQL